MENNAEKNYYKRIIKTILKYLLCTTILVIVFSLCLFLTALISRNVIEKNVQESSEILVKEGVTKNYTNFGEPTYTDNQTDAIMLNIVYSIDDKNIIESLIRARRNYIPGVTDKTIPDTIGNLKHEDKNYNMTTELKKLVDGSNQTSYEYARYWHGYMIILRPLLVLFNITEIRIIFQCIIYILIIILLVLLAKNKGIGYSISLLITFVMSDLFNYFIVLQGLFVIVVALLYSILISLKIINDKNLFISMFVVGGITQYFDFLTTPIISLLLPLIIYCIINEEELSTREVIRKVFISFVLWGIGYSLLWSIKWVICDVTYCKEIIQKSIQQVQFRTVAAIDGYHIYDGLIYNIYFFFTGTNISILIISLCLYFYNFFAGVIISFQSNKKYIINHKIIKEISLFSIIITVFWYFVLCQHSIQHSFYTYRNILIIYYSLMNICYCDFSYIKQTFEKLKKL